MTVDTLLPLEMLRPGEWADIAEVCGEPAWICRMAELGIRAGSRVQVVRDGSPCLLRVAGSQLCVRGCGCSQVLVRPVPPTAPVG
jgi:ferrous iron transport protein A